MAILEPIWVDEVKQSTYDLSNLPKDIEDNIKEYLLLELSPKNEDISLKYVNTFQLWKKPIMCWEYGDNDLFVTVQPYGNSYYIGLTSKEVAI